MNSGEIKVDQLLVGTLKRKRNTENVDIITLFNIIKEYLGFKTLPRVQTFVYLIKTFDLKLKDVSRLGAWNGFDDGCLSDMEVIRLFDDLMAEGAGNEN